jgi:hypothetical protein
MAEPHRVDQRQRRAGEQTAVTYTLIGGIDLPEAIDRHGRLGRLATVETVEALPFTLHERAAEPSD